MTTQRLEAWIEEQKRLVEMGGRTVGTFVLEGPDGKTWGTYPATADDLPKLCGESTRALESSLPSGQHHTGKWVALDREGAQLACMPVTMRGQSSEAAGAAKDALAFTRATANHLLATEQLVTILQNQVRHLGDQLEAAQLENVELREALQTRAESNLALEVERIQAVNGEQRLNAALEELKPMLGIAGSLISERMVKWFEEQKNAKRKPKRGKPGKRGSVAPESNGAGPANSNPQVRNALHAAPAESPPGAPTGDAGTSAKPVRDRASRARGPGARGPKAPAASRARAKDVRPTRGARKKPLPRKGTKR